MNLSFDLGSHVRTGREFIVTCPLWVPYVRVGQERFTARAKRYLQSRDALAKFIIHTANEQRFGRDSFGLYAVSMHVFLHARKSRRKGESKGSAIGVSSNRGDLDNYLKAALDAAQHAEIIGNDSPDRWLQIDATTVHVVSPTTQERGVIRFAELTDECVNETAGDSFLEMLEAQRKAATHAARSARFESPGGTPRVTREG